MADLSREELRRLASLGARARLAELRSEEAAIRGEFPELAAKQPSAPEPAAESAPAAPVRRRRKRRMSAEAREAVSVRMKKYWADQRKAKGAKAKK